MRLRDERKSRGWSQTTVTVLTGIAQSDLSAIETGKRPPYPGWRKRLAQAFGMSETDLFGQAPEQPEAGR